MRNILSKLTSSTKSNTIEPRDIFMSLPDKDKQFEYPRDVQADVWSKWYQERNNNTNIIKMNTGSGKTIVGLVILQSCLNEGKGPAVYVVPDRFLVDQVCDEAKKIGIRVTQNKNDYFYTEKKAILVLPIHALVNGRSAFGLRQNNNYPLESVLIDDVHACIETISTQFSIKIQHNHALYKRIIELFSPSWNNYDQFSYERIINSGDTERRFLIPFWIWQEKVNRIHNLLAEYNNASEQNDSIYFHLPLLRDCLMNCNCVITAKSVEIIPFGISIDKITSFKNAKRKIYMSATLSDDSVFISTMGIDKNEIRKIIVPNSANDVGDRLILFPKHLNGSLTDTQIRDKILTFTEKYNVIVIVPSKERALFWDMQKTRTVTKENISDTVQMLKKQHLGLRVFVNRYDGIDLPGDACRMLVIDGLPPLKNEYEKYIQTTDYTGSLLQKEQIQRIEQGMGRGVRSNSDSCCVVLMGEQLADILLRHKGPDLFSNATNAQYQLSKELWDSLLEDESKPTVDQIFELADYSLNRDKEWIQLSRGRLANVFYPHEPKFDNTTLLLRNAFDSATSGQLIQAASYIDEAVNGVPEESTKGLLLQLKACYYNQLDKSTAQEILLAAKSLNKQVLSPINGIQYGKEISRKKQASSVVSYVHNMYPDPNDMVRSIDTITSCLSFSCKADVFERAVMDAGSLLGFFSTRPDKDTRGAGPDNLWVVDSNTIFVIECKNESNATEISKDYCNQLGGSIRWCRNSRGGGYRIVPVIVHPSDCVKADATPVENMRVMTKDCVEHFRDQLKHFVVALSQNDNWNNEQKVQSLLRQYKLRSVDIVNEFTTSIKTGS